MVKLQVSDLANRVHIDKNQRKRKRSKKDDAGATEGQHGSNQPDASIDLTDDAPDAFKPGAQRRKAAGANGKPTLKRNSSSTVVECKIPWPERLSQLEKIHRALTLVYTFFTTRKQLATTFDNLKGPIESHLKKKVSIEDIAQIKALIPRAIAFEYVSKAMLELHLMGEDNVGGGSRVGGLLAHVPDTYSMLDDEDEEVLLFEYVDGDLKREVEHAKTGEPTKATRTLRQEDVKMPVFGQKQMLKMIEKRNTKFTSAINAFVNECVDEGIDPCLKLEDITRPHIPERTTTPVQEEVKAPAVIPAVRQSIPEILEEIKTLEWYTGQIVPDGHRVFDPQPPVHGELNFELSQSLVNALYHSRGITEVYAHQAEAINGLYEGRNVIVSTSTSSGKSLIYQLPVLHELQKDRNTRAMYIFPTKALAQDQLKGLKDFLQYMPEISDILVDTFDGDTPKEARNLIRDEARIIFTNPDMLHITILPQEEAWRAFLQNLRFVVVDELHVYNGLFGAHVALVMRRLRRICAAVGNRHVKFISCSATVANPEEHFKMIFGIDQVKLVDFDGSPSGRKEFLCWNTPFKDPGDPTSGRGDVHAEAAKLFCQLILRGVRVIAFARIRRQCEILITAVRNELKTLERSEVAARVMAYRGGYTPQDRRKIEVEMFEGKLVGIVATNALELGVDIGSLDAVLTVGFPYTIANLRQQSGRAGRRNKDSLSVLIGDCFPTDQYFMQNPDEIFTRPNCELQVDLGNMLVLEGHIQCAAHEMPIRPNEDSVYFGKGLPEVVEGRLRKDAMGFYHTNERYLPRPSRHVGIRDTEDDHFAIIDTTNDRNVVLGELEASRAFFTIYLGGIFLHQGNTYLVRDVSQEKMCAKVKKVTVDWITQQRDYTDLDPIETEAIRQFPYSLSRAFYGTVRIKAVVFGFFKIDKRRRILDAVSVDNPPITLYSKGMWIDVPKRALDILNQRRLNIAAAIHAAEHAFLSLMPNFVISMPGDVRTECKNALKEFAKKESQRKRPARLTFYDAKGGASGSGISTKAFEFVDMLLVQACERVEACHCEEGCLECCCSELCREQNMVMSKAGAEVIFKALLDRPIDVDALPWGPEDENVPAGIETVIPATTVRPRRGERVEVIEIKREEGGSTQQTIVVGSLGDGENEEDDCVMIKDEPEE